VGGDGDIPVLFSWKRRISFLLVGTKEDRIHEERGAP